MGQIDYSLDVFLLNGSTLGNALGNCCWSGWFPHNCRFAVGSNGTGKAPSIIQLKELNFVSSRIGLEHTRFNQILIDISDQKFLIDFSKDISIYFVFDCHRFVPVRRNIGGSIRIPYEIMIPKKPV
jgi:hypothetical protein